AGAGPSSLHRLIFWSREPRRIVSCTTREKASLKAQVTASGPIRPALLPSNSVKRSPVRREYSPAAPSAQSTRHPLASGVSRSELTRTLLFCSSRELQRRRRKNGKQMVRRILRLYV